MGKRESLTSFLERVEPDEKSRRKLLRRLAERVHLVRALDLTKDRFEREWADAGGEFICRTNDFATVCDLKAVVVRDARTADLDTPPYPWLQKIAYHLVDVMEGIEDPDWELIRWVFIEDSAIVTWEAAARHQASSVTSTIVVPQASQHDGKADEGDGEDKHGEYPWAPTARGIGSELLRQEKWKRRNLEQLAEAVRSEMEIRMKEKVPGTYAGRGGRLPSAATIKRHALAGLKA